MGIAIALAQYLVNGTWEMVLAGCWSTSEMSSIANIWKRGLTLIPQFPFALLCYDGDHGTRDRPMWSLVPGEDSSTGNATGGRKLARYVFVVRRRAGPDRSRRTIRPINRRVCNLMS
jgi:hypothetical protein